MISPIQVERVSDERVSHIRDGWRELSGPENELVQICDELLALRTAGEWQPIASAPKDGTRLLIACIGECGTRWMYVAWNKGSRWRLIEKKDRSYIEVNDTPTHWKALPPGPMDRGRE